ncbi:MAG: hypothetical protein AAFR39_05355 [Pseudomonadota bacterium]
MKFLRAQEINNNADNYIGLLQNAKSTSECTVIWIGALAVVRSVGHVIKYEARKTRKGADIEARLWKTWKDEPVCKWLMSARNEAIKQGELQFSASQIFEIKGYTTAGLRSEGEYREFSVNVKSAEEIEEFADLPVPDQIISTCINWWDQKILEIRSDAGWKT